MATEEAAPAMDVDDPIGGTGDGDADTDAEEGASDAEAAEDAEAKAALLASLPEVSLDLFDLIKSAQGQHGLRHGDYGRYRAYCSRRLHRLRRTLKCTHGSKNRYVKKKLEPTSVRESRHLMLPLFCAERAWSLAMQLKRDNATNDEPRPRYHLLHRLAKAVKWSKDLAALSAIRGDQRTALEAEAYAAFMAGNNELEREHWAPALAAFKRTVKICTELCRVSLSEQAHLYRQMAAEVDPSIRFCAYNLRRMGELPEGEEEEEGVEGLADAEGASDILRSKLESVLQETRSKQAKHLTDVEVLGERVPIKSDKARVALLRAQELLLEVGVATLPGGAKQAERKPGEEAADEDRGTPFCPYVAHPCFPTSQNWIRCFSNFPRSSRPAGLDRRDRHVRPGLCGVQRRARGGARRSALGHQGAHRQGRARRGPAQQASLTQVSHEPSLARAEPRTSLTQVSHKSHTPLFFSYPSHTRTASPPHTHTHCFPPPPHTPDRPCPFPF